MKDQKSLRGGQLLAKYLKEKGVDHVFTLAGGFCNPALEGFMNYQMPVVNCPHEQIAGHLADGHARLTRKPTVCIVGPEGFANAIPAMMEAWGERSPVIFITGSSTLKKQGAGGFKEIDDVSIAEPLTKYSASITDGTRISEFVDRAWRIATSGYPGPVHLSMPVDIMFSSFPEENSLGERPYSNKAPKIFRAWPEPKALEHILEIIKNSRKPIIIGGHGIWWSKTEHLLKRIGDEIKIPIFNVPYHQKLLNEDCEAFLGLADVHQYHPSKFAFNESDCILMVGGKLDNQMNFGNPPLFPSDTKLICVNGSHEEIEFNRSADHLLLCDPGAFFESLLDLKHTNQWSHDQVWLDINLKEREKWISASIADLKKTTDSPAWSGGKIHPLQLSLSVQNVMKNDDILVFDGGNTHFWSEIAVNIAGKNGLALHQIMHPGSYSMLGVGVSFALSAKSLNPSRTVVLISGDGAFLSGGLSIEAAFQENLPIVVIVDNNGGLDCISQQQERLFKDGSHFATDFRDIPFHGLFTGMGGHGELVTHKDEIEGAVRRAIESGKPACVNVKTKGVISPIVAATSDKRDKASIE
ncbi:MAG: thiamine pyrophosphate-binding protein [Pseudomonadota bacterium]|nr:thiamine pyrophosphate-binding protein [Pseudomonadota bacterium]